MQVTETLSEGLKRGFTVVVPSADIEDAPLRALTARWRAACAAGLPPRQGAGPASCASATARE